MHTAVLLDLGLGRAVEVGLSALYLGGVAFVLWVLLHDGGARFTVVGATLIVAMVCLVPVVVLRMVLSLMSDESPAVVRWLTPAEGVLIATTIVVLVVRPGLVGHKRAHPI